MQRGWRELIYIRDVFSVNNREMNGPFVGC